MNFAQRRRNYLRQPAGKRIHFFGSEGGVTGPMRRRLTHKLNHARHAALMRQIESHIAATEAGEPR